MLEFGNAKSVLIIVPHEDDEINLMGGLLPLLVEKKLTVSVCFITNGDYAVPGEVRIKEALASLECLGIADKNIYFLGYPDASDVVDHSLYKTKIPVKSQKGIYTYGISQKKEYRMAKSEVHHLNIYENLVRDMTNLILDLQPEVIFCTDLDGHHDHRLTSLLFEECLYNILLENIYYRPLIFKGFAYATTYEGVDDFFTTLNVSAAIKPSKNQLAFNAISELDNPLYKWEERVRFPVSEEALNRKYWRNKLAKAMCCHKSQFLRKRMGRIINSDVVFWQINYSELHSFDINNIEELHKPLKYQTLSKVQINEDTKYKVNICKILIDNEFAYRRFYTNKKNIYVEIYTYNIQGPCKVMVNGKELTKFEELELSRYSNKIQISVYDCQGKLLDETEIRRCSKPKTYIFKLGLSILKLSNYILYKLQKVFGGRK